MDRRTGARQSDAGSGAYRRERDLYLTGLGLTLALTLPPFAMVVFHLAQRETIL